MTRTPPIAARLSALMPQDSALPRPLDPSVPSNRFALIGIVAGAALAKVAGRGWVQAAGVGVAGLAAWAAARELDPDHPETANAALPVAALAALLGGVPNPLAAFTSVSGLRVLAATVGHAPSEMDLRSLGVQSVLAGLMGERVAAALPGAALAVSAEVDDRYSPPPQSAVMAGAGLLPNLHRVARSGVVSDLLCLAALGTLGTLDAPERVSSRCDLTNAPLSAARVQRARQVALGTLLSALALRQTRSLTPLAAAVLSVGWRRAAK